MKKYLSMLFMLIVSVSLLTGCGKSETDNASAADTSGAANKKVAIIVKGTENVFYQSLKTGADAASKETGLDFYFTGSSSGETDINGQVNLVENAISQKVAGIIIAASDAKALVPVTEKAIAAGIPVVVVDSGLATEKYASYLTTDNVAAAAASGEYLAKKLNGKGKVAIVNFVAGAQGAVEREKGFREALSKYPDIQILPTQYYNNDKQKALALTQDILTANPDLDGIFACNEPGTVGVGRALKEKNNQKVITVGFDFSDDILPLLKEGYVNATIVQMPYNMGYLGLKTMADILNGKEVPKNQDTKFTLVTTENVDSPESQKALYPGGSN